MAVVAGILSALPAQASITELKDSSDFGTYRYEMDVNATGQDLDSNTTADFTVVGGDGSVSNGYYSYDSPEGGIEYLSSDTAARAWGVLDGSYLTGWTVEVRLRVNSEIGADGAAVGINVSPYDTSSDAFIYVGINSVVANADHSIVLDGASDNTGFHSYRIAQEAGNVQFSVWRDGVLLTSTLGDGHSHTGLNRLFVGDFSNGYGGNVDIDYVRFTDGAYAPFPVIIPCDTNPPPQIALADSELFIASPADARTLESAFYTRKSGGDMISRHLIIKTSDTPTVGWERRSADHGETWSEPEEFWVLTEDDELHRRGFLTSLIDPVRDTLLTMRMELDAPLGTSPWDALRYWRLHYTLSNDGGETYYHDAQIIDGSGGFSSTHPLPGIWEGENCAMMGDMGCVPLRISSTGNILVPIQINQTNAQTIGFFDSAVLVGSWNGANTLDWQLSERVVATTNQSSRGLFEPTISEMPDGRILMVMRSTSGYKWYSVSEDHGLTWSAAQPWTYSEGTPVYSVSSMSQLLRYGNGRYYWIGNVSSSNPGGASTPRYPLVIGEVDPATLLLKKETLFAIDNRRPDDPAELQLSNFHAREDRQTAEIVVHLSPFRREDPEAYEGDAYLYRLKVSSPATWWESLLYSTFSGQIDVPAVPDPASCHYTVDGEPNHAGAISGGRLHSMGDWGEQLVFFGRDLRDGGTLGGDESAGNIAVSYGTYMDGGEDSSTNLAYACKVLDDAGNGYKGTLTRAGDMELFRVDAGVSASLGSAAGTNGNFRILKLSVIDGIVAFGSHMDGTITVSDSTHGSFSEIALGGSGIGSTGLNVDNVSFNGYVGGRHAALSAASGSMVKMTINAPTGYHPLSRTNLLDGTWGRVPHSDDPGNPFSITNLAYSTMDTNGHHIIYLQLDGAVRFFGLLKE